MYNVTLFFCSHLMLVVEVEVVTMTIMVEEEEVVMMGIIWIGVLEARLRGVEERKIIIGRHHIAKQEGEAVQELGLKENVEDAAKKV